MVRPVTVKPNTGDLAKPCAKFAHLSVQEPNIVGPCHTTLLTEAIGWMMPIQERAIKSQLQIAAPGAGVCQLMQWIAAERCASHFVIAQRRIVHAEAIVMAAGDDYISLTCIGRNAGHSSALNFTG